MAKQQTSGPEKSGAQPERVEKKDGALRSGTPDEHYNLVSVLYHALQGAELYAEYAEDAERAGDTELADFFQQIQDEEDEQSEGRDTTSS